MAITAQLIGQVLLAIGVSISLYGAYKFFQAIDQ